MKLLLDIPDPPPGASDECGACPHRHPVREELDWGPEVYFCRVFNQRLKTRLLRDLGPPVTAEQRATLPEWARELPMTNETAERRWLRCAACRHCQRQAEKHHVRIA